MNDLEYQRQTQVYVRDMYRDLGRIEERGKRLRKARKGALTSIFGRLWKPREHSQPKTA